MCKNERKAPLTEKERVKQGKREKVRVRLKEGERVKKSVRV